MSTVMNFLKEVLKIAIQKNFKCLLMNVVSEFSAAFPSPNRRRISDKNVVPEFSACNGYAKCL